jgi:DNA mismatch endonuclease, patch repair protein
MDKITSEARSRNMSKIKAKNTKPELKVRSILYSQGYRYRIHYPLEGKPDIVFPKKKVAIFVNGCFWHGHGCKIDHVSKSNSEFWLNKISNNKERDKKINQNLTNEGWKVLTIWECDKLSDISKMWKLLR